MNALAEDNLEAWIVSHVWTFIVDMALKDIEETKIGKYVINVQTKIIIAFLQY